MAVVSAVLAIGLPPSRSSDLPPRSGGEASCATHVISDWVNDGSVEGRYRLSCYQEAIRRLPEDLRAYSSAEDDIHGAMQLVRDPPS